MTKQLHPAWAAVMQEHDTDEMTDQDVAIAMANAGYRDCIAVIALPDGRRYFTLPPLYVNGAGAAEDDPPIEGGA